MHTFSQIWREFYLLFQEKLMHLDSTNDNLKASEMFREVRTSICVHGYKSCNSVHATALEEFNILGDITNDISYKLCLSRVSTRMKSQSVLQIFI